LRLAGFRFDTIPRYLAFDVNVLGAPFAEPDPDLFWRLRRGVVVDTGSGFRARLSPSGFRDSHWGERREGVLRVLCLGDSCTFGQATTWPRELGRILEREGTRAEVLNAGIPGYSTLQGLRLLRGPLAGEPFDLALASFGYNDAKPAAGGISDARRRPLPPWRFALREILGDLRLFQAAAKLRSPPVGSLDEMGGAPRVSLDEFDANLRAIADECARRGARAVVLTVPSLIPRDDATPRRPLHAYNDRVRALAREGALEAIDVEEAFRDIGNDGLFDGVLEIPAGELGVADPIHPNDLGLRVIAERVARLAAERGLLPAPATPAPLHPEGARHFALSSGDLDGDGTDELGAAVAGDGSIRSSWTSVHGSPASEPVEIDASPREGSVALAARADGATVVAARFDGPDPFFAEVRGGAVVRREALRLATDDPALASFTLARAEGSDEIVLALPDAAGALLRTIDLEASAGAGRRVALQRVEACWSLAAGEILPDVAGAEFLLAPGPLRPRRGWLGFATVSSDGAVLEGTLAYGHGGFGAGVRLALARRSEGRPPVLAVARGACIRLFERRSPVRDAGWVALDALFPFGASALPLHGGGVAIALVPAREGRAARTVFAWAEEEEGLVLREVSTDGGFPRDIRIR